MNAPPLRSPAAPPVWLFDLDNTLHDATSAAYAGINEGMSAFIERELGIGRPEADALRRHYWLRYGATLLGMVRHHGVRAAHFLHEAHLLPGLEQRVRGHGPDLRVLARLPGRRYILTNAPAAYTARVLGVLGITHLFDGVIAVEDMRMFGVLRPKPDARMFRALAARLRTTPGRCVLVEDTPGHLKAAHGVGMATVWLDRWLPLARPRRRPVYVDRRIGALRELLR